MAEDLGERTEDATPRRLQQAREEGNVSKSQDVASALLLLAVTALLWLGFGPTMGRLKLVVEAMLSSSGLGDPLDPDTVWPSVLYVSAATVGVVLPLLALIWVAGYLSHFWQVGWLFSPKVLQPNLNKLDPIKGFQKIFGVRGLVKVSLDLCKVTLVVVVAAFTIHQHHREIVWLPYLTAGEGLVQIGRMMVDLALRVLAVLLLLGVLDFAFQRWRHAQDLKMTKQEVKDEFKHTEGDPEVKKRRMRIQQQLALQRIASAVPRADVIVTNPEHISIAIKYEAGEMAAPKVIAKGADHLAFRIRRLALQHGVPVIERPPLARALYKQVRIGQEVPPEFYQAVAEVLAYVYRVSGRRAG